MVHYKRIKGIVDERTLIDAIHKYGRKNRSQDKSRKGFQLGEKGLVCIANRPAMVRRMPFWASCTAGYGISRSVRHLWLLEVGRKRILSENSRGYLYQMAFEATLGRRETPTGSSPLLTLLSRRVNVAGVSHAVS